MRASLVPYDLSSGIGEIIGNVNPIRQNFSSQYQYNINQISDENEDKDQFGDKKLIIMIIIQNSSNVSHFLSYLYTYPPTGTSAT